MTAWTGPRGPILASYGVDGTIRRWNATTGAPADEPITGTRVVAALTAWSGPHGPMLAAASDDRRICLWDATTGALAADPMTGHSSVVVALTAWSGRDGPMLATSDMNGTIERWDATTGAAVGDQMTGHTDCVRALTAWIGRDGPMLASASDDRGIRRWNALTGAPIGDPMTGHTSGVAALTTWTIRGGPPMLASAGVDGTIRRWNARTGAPVGEPMIGHTSGVAALTTWTGPDGLMLASASDDGTIRRWNALTGAPVGEPMTGHTRPVTALVSWKTPDGYAMMASTSDEGTIRRWNGAAAAPAGEPLPDNSSVLTAWTDPQDRTILISTRFGAQIMCWDAAAVGTLEWNSFQFQRRGYHSPFAQRLQPAQIDVLTAWAGPDGPMLAFAGVDGTIWRWDATTGAPVGGPMTGHSGGVRALTTWTGPGGPMLASAGDDGTIRRWDATTGAPVGGPMPGHSGGVRALTTWTGPGGPMLASAGDDGGIRRWDATKGDRVGALMTVQGGGSGVRALITWTGPGGRMLASAGVDGTIRRWNATTGEQVGDPMTGHSSGVLALTTWTGPDGPVLASGGADGTIQVWNAETGEFLHRVFVEPIRLRGLADRPADRDLLDRGALTQALANLLLWRPATTGGETGPSVVTFEGPWGTGKTTVMRLVEARIAAKPESLSTPRHMSVARARKILRKPEPAGDSPSMIASERYRGALTAWFNPWVYQSSEQVWAGLAQSVTKAAEPVLYPAKVEGRSDSYWLDRNVQWIDGFAVSRSMLFRVISPLLGFSVITGLATVLISLAKLNNNTLFYISHQRISLSILALVIAVLLLFAGALHTLARYYGPARRFLPGDLIRGSVLSGSLSEDLTEVTKNLRNPSWAKSGYLSLMQEDTARTIRDLRDVGYDLVVFIDDLDRCSARTTAEVFEAINLFLSGVTDLAAKFVIGLDPAVVAAQLDTVYKKDLDASLVQYGDDPSPGWAFLRKVVQLPVGAPRVTNPAIDQFLEASLDVPIKKTLSSPNVIEKEMDSGTDVKLKRQCQSVATDTGMLPVSPPAAGPNQSRTGSLERQPEIIALIRQRLAAQPERSAREAKRLLNVWQLYQRVLDLVAPLSDDEAVIERACHLVILAEIVTRWPAMQRRLHQSVDGRRGLQILAAACGDDNEWDNALTVTRLDLRDYSRAVKNLRDLLRTYEGSTVANLAERVL